MGRNFSRRATGQDLALVKGAISAVSAEQFLLVSIPDLESTEPSELPGLRAAIDGVRFETQSGDQ